MGQLALIILFTWVLTLIPFRSVAAEKMSDDQSSSNVVELREVVIYNTPHV